MTILFSSNKFSNIKFSPFNEYLQSTKSRNQITSQIVHYQVNNKQAQLTDNNTNNNNNIKYINNNYQQQNSMRFWAVSDLHTDYADNYNWCQSLSTTEYCEDCLIVAGDVTDELDKLKRTLICLKERFREVFFTPGNHELWLRLPQRNEMDSLEKLELIMELCAKVGVRTEPTMIEGVWVVPILSWYHSSWDKLPDLPGAIPIEKAMIDFQLCQWPDGLRQESLAAHFDHLNNTQKYSQLINNLNQFENQKDRPFIISFSHFLPLQQLLPGKLFLRYSNLHKAAGSEFLRERVENLQPDIHIFGHTHFLWDEQIGCTRYIQWPLGYPRERQRALKKYELKDQTPKLLYDTSTVTQQQQQQFVQLIQD